MGKPSLHWSDSPLPEIPLPRKEFLVVFFFLILVFLSRYKEDKNGEKDSHGKAFLFPSWGGRESLWVPLYSCPNREKRTLKHSQVCSDVRRGLSPKEAPEDLTKLKKKKKFVKKKHSLRFYQNVLINPEKNKQKKQTKKEEKKNVTKKKIF